MKVVLEVIFVESNQSCTVKMGKSILILGFIAIFATALAVDCPEQDETSEAVYYPHETECGKFYECDHGKATLFNCPYGLYWDQRLNVCNRNVDCGDLLTSTVPPATTDGPGPTDGPEPTDEPEPTEPPPTEEA